MTALLWAGAALAVWPFVALALAVVCGKAIHAAEDAPDVLDTWPDDLPVEVLSQAEIDRRAARMDVWI